MLLLILDILIVLLLLITLGAGFRLHRSLLRLQTNNQEFEQLVQSLDTAAKRAESALSGLKQRAEETSSKLNEEANDVQRLLDDLRFMKDHSEQLVDKLEGAIGRARAQEAKPAPPPATNGGMSPTMERPASRQSDLERRLKTLR